MHNLDLAGLAAPLSPAAFLKEYWEKKPFISHHSADTRFAGLFGLKEFDETLSSSNISAPFIRLARDGKMLPISGLRTAGPFGHVGMLDRLYEEYRGGATIILQAIQERRAPLRQLCQTLANDFSAAFQVNAYLTPAGEQGFATHYDTHDVFVLQLEGSKRWRVYGDPVILPTLEEPPSRTQRVSGELIEEFTLKPGELIYLPRGWWHDAAAVDETSLHLTVGVFPMTWGVLALHAMESAIAADPKFREAVPPGFAVQGAIAEEATEQWAEMVEQLCTELGRGVHFQDAVSAARSGRQPALEGYLLDLSAAQTIALETKVRPREGLDVLLEPAGDRILLLFNGKSVGFPAFVEPALRSLAEGTCGSAGTMGGDLDDDARLLIVRRLVEEGLLAIERKS